IEHIGRVRFAWRQIEAFEKRLPGYGRHAVNLDGADDGARPRIDVEDERGLLRPETQLGPRLEDGMAVPAQAQRVGDKPRNVTGPPDGRRPTIPDSDDSAQLAGVDAGHVHFAGELNFRCEADGAEDVTK